MSQLFKMSKQATSTIFKVEATHTQRKAVVCVHWLSRAEGPQKAATLCGSGPDGGLTRDRSQLTAPQQGPGAGGAIGDFSLSACSALGFLMNLQLGECGVPTVGYLLPN